MPSDILNADSLLLWFHCDNLVGNGGLVTDTKNMDNTYGVQVFL